MSCLPAGPPKALNTYLLSYTPYTYRITSQGLSNLKLNRSLSIFYEDFEIHDTHNFAESIDFTILANASLSLNLAYSKINLTKKLKFPFKVPKSYEVIY